MNDYTRRNLESGQRCRQWFIDYAALIPGGSIFETKSTAMTTKVGVVENLAGQQSAAVGEGLSATDVKGSERQDLLDAMKPVRTAARAAEFDVPGTRDRYRYNVSMSDQELLATGRSFAAGDPTTALCSLTTEHPAIGGASSPTLATPSKPRLARKTRPKASPSP